ncbi:MAG: hypothetical protein V1820_05700 [archaeon]
MELKFSKGKLIFDKVLNSLDKFTIDFIEVLDKKQVRYVLVSGYVAILFGRSRSSEDVDIFIEKMGKNKFLSLWKALSKGFECVNTANPEDGYANYFSEGVSIRFARKGQFVPNMEVKQAEAAELGAWALANRKTVLVNKKVLKISPIELQIPFKLKLGSEKDIEDARHLNKIFGERLDKELLGGFAKRLKIERRLELLE